jgi:acyl-CoA reductase-like NAD-dependent aldehyde dehydrogenase
MRIVRPFLSGDFVDTGRRRAVRSPWDGRTVAEVEEGGPAEVERALSAAFAARATGRELPAGRRRELCLALAEGIRRREADLVASMCDEAGKPVRSARVEVQRAVMTFSLAAAELTRFGGEVVPVDLDPATAGYEAVVRRVPAGVVVAISPFNFPLNLGAHKVAPALAVGAPVIWKPPPQAPGAAGIVAELARDAGVPAGLLQVLPCPNEAAEQLAVDERVAVVSFTGSAAVGWALKRKVGRARVVLELGGNAAAVIAADADLAKAAARLALGAFSYAGQVCIKVQRVLVERGVYAAFRERLLAETAKLPAGDPADEATVVGPIIEERHVDRILAWVEEARARGAKVHGGGRQGSVLLPVILEDVPEDARVSAEEVFGPVVILTPFDRFEEAIATVNRSRYGLQAAVFTRDLQRVRRAFRELEVGGVIVNDYPTFRQDVMPYGGVKESGLGREGLAYAMADYTEPRLLVTAP